MKYQLLFALLLFNTGLVFGQYDYNSGNTLKYWAEHSDQKYLIGAYGEIHYNQSLGTQLENGILDVHRLVLLNGYQFNDRVSFLSEIEFEHINEITVEQAFLNYRFSSLFNMQAGLLLIPMGILNEYHEPTTFYSVERPILDNKIVPSTWREIGFGFSGNSIRNSIQYQLYMINGFIGYDGSPKFNANNGFRSGRQKGAESIIFSPNISGKINYYGIKGLQLGLSYYAGQSQSSLYDDLDRSDDVLKAQADSSTVFINMVGMDARYNRKKLHLRAQFNFVDVIHAEAYNTFTGSDLAEQLLGFYFEGAYSLFQTKESDEQFIIFSRIEFVDTNFRTSGDFKKNKEYTNWILTSGLNWRIGSSVVIKSDYQLRLSQESQTNRHQLNIGVGFWFR